MRGMYLVGVREQDKPKYFKLLQDLSNNPIFKQQIEKYELEDDLEKAFLPRDRLPQFKINEDYVKKIIVKLYDKWYFPTYVR